MKFVKATLATLAAASFAIAQPAAAASADRLAAPVDEAEGQAASALWIVLAFVGLLAIGEATGLFDIFGDDEEPASP